MAEFELEGALFIEPVVPPPKSVKFMLSENKKLLAVISLTIDSSHRVDVLERKNEPHWRVPVWASIDGQSITDTLESAEKIAAAKLKDFSR